MHIVNNKSYALNPFWAFPDDIDEQRKWCFSRAPTITFDLQIDLMIEELQYKTFGELRELQQDYHANPATFQLKNQYLEIDPDRIDDILESLEDTMAKQTMYCDMQSTRDDGDFLKLLPTKKEIEKYAERYLPSEFNDPEYQRNQHFYDVRYLRIYDICKRAQDKIILELDLNGKPYSEKYRILEKVKAYAQSIID